MKTKGIIISIILGLIITIGAFLAVFGPFLKNLSSDATSDAPVTATSTTATTTSVTPKPKPVTQTPKTPTATTPAPAASGYTMADVAAHSSATSCWSAIGGEVYDLTSWVNAHPGGRAAILMICGKDGSPLFDSQHGGARRPANILANYKIGALK